MNLPVIYDEGLNGGLNKWSFGGWFRRNVAIIAAVCALINPLLGAVVGAIGALEGVQGLNGELEDLQGMNSTEQAAMDFWVENKFKPYIKKLVSKISRGFEQSSLDQQVAILNDALFQMAVLRTHFMDVYEKGFSEAMASERGRLLESILGPLDDFIVKRADKLPNNILKKSLTINFADVPGFLSKFSDLGIDVFLQAHTDVVSTVFSIIEINTTVTPIVLPVTTTPITTFNSTTPPVPVFQPLVPTLEQSSQTFNPMETTDPIKLTPKVVTVPPMPPSSDIKPNSEPPYLFYGILGFLGWRILK